MQNDLISLVKLDTVHLYIDYKKKILFFDVLTSNYSKDDSITVLEYFKNFWLLAYEQDVKYYLVIKINSIGIYPLSFYNNLIDCLFKLNNILSTNLHSCCFLSNDNNPLIILKPLFNSYTFIRPYTVCSTYEEVLLFFNKPENQIK